MRNHNIKEMLGFGIVLSMLLFMASLTSCGGGRSQSIEGRGEEIVLHHSELLKIRECSGYTEVTVKNPWDSLKQPQRYLLVPRDSVMPSDLPKGTVIRTPVNNVLVYSTIHASLFNEMGRGKAIGGMCDVEFVEDSVYKERLRDRSLIDCGNSQNPNIERILSLNPDLIMLSPFENNNQYSKVAQIGIPVFECTDYMETSPLGRAEWIRLYGMIFAVNDKAERLFSSIESEYQRLCSIASKAEKKPKVLIDQRYGQVWNVPCGQSTMGRLIEDAGGRNPFASFKRSGSVGLSPEKVLTEAFDADIWLVRYNQQSDKTLSELAADSPVNSKFEAFRNGKVFGCNTGKVKLFEDTPFHPERVLQDLVIIFHPELMTNSQLNYFHKMK